MEKRGGALKHSAQDRSLLHKQDSRLSSAKHCSLPAAQRWVAMRSSSSA